MYITKVEHKKQMLDVRRQMLAVSMVITSFTKSQKGSEFFHIISYFL